MKKVYFDFETRSAVDLKKAGAHVYAAHETTGIVCLAWAVDDGPVQIYRPLDGDPVPKELLVLAKFSKCIFIAHNASFDRLIWNHVCHKRLNWPELPIERFECSMVMALSMGLQGSLANASANVGLPVSKDAKGHRVMLQLAKPREHSEDALKVKWWTREDSKPGLDINAKYDMVYKYCVQDIVVLRELHKRLLPLSPSETILWRLDQKINDRGVFIDRPAGKSAIKLADEETKFLNEEVVRITGGFVRTLNSSAALAKWITMQGVPCDSVAKNVVRDLLEEELPSNVREVLELRQSGAKSSVNKINRMLDSSESKIGRAQGCFQFYGAASTGRWAGRRIQLQNMPRPELKQWEINDILDTLGKVSL